MATDATRSGQARPTTPGGLLARRSRGARKLAERYRLEFVDMDEFRIDQELFRSIPADLMLRYGFVPVPPRRQVRSSSSSPTRPTCR